MTGKKNERTPLALTPTSPRAKKRKLHFPHEDTKLLSSNRYFQMKTNIVRREPPEVEELARKKRELAGLETELAERELDLSTLETELRAFERRYLRTVGIFYAEIDEIEAQIAEAIARANPIDTEARERASDARSQAQESARSTKDISNSKERDDFKPTGELKDLYRSVAKKIHPDLATNEVERTKRTILMADANRAYEEGDAARLQSILDEWESSPERVQGEDVGAELIRTIRKIAQVQSRLKAIDARMDDLMTSDLYTLRDRVREAEELGRSLLDEMAEKLREQIKASRTRLADIRTQEATA